MNDLSFKKFIISLLKQHEGVPETWRIALEEQGLMFNGKDDLVDLVRFKIGDIVTFTEPVEGSSLPGKIIAIEDSHYEFEGGTCWPVDRQYVLRLATKEEIQECKPPAEREEKLPDFEAEIVDILVTREWEGSLETEEEVEEAYARFRPEAKDIAARLLPLARKELGL